MMDVIKDVMETIGRFKWDCSWPRRSADDEQARIAFSRNNRRSTEDNGRDARGKARTISVSREVNRGRIAREVFAVGR